MSQPMPLSEYCGKAVPWYCAAGWIPLIGAPIAYSQQCREAYDLERACNAGGFPRNIPSGSGAGKAPDSAAQPGVNYNDPAVLQSIYEEQLRNNKTTWDDTIKAIMKTISGAPRAGDDLNPKEPGPNWTLWVLVGVLVYLIAFVMPIRFKK